jgi:hypothetical protein
MGRLIYKFRDEKKTDKVLHDILKKVGVAL